MRQPKEFKEVQLTIEEYNERILQAYRTAYRDGHVKGHMQGEDFRDTVLEQHKETIRQLENRLHMLGY
jgi:flagellar biosynthesis/type III secretory pathway protein FliH